ncbi:MAG: tripartite tricarboxylate transporter substrate binding protein [Rhodocyclaceae bacterium]|nr:tripartite tricarboxylate transporter substrate binding protein [Rhodocyclaceae bacterium]MCA3024092.1 tripartite tricarboxylate transporter substrate binding protein [Rhodocyclaceae bacterium]MCA3033429.1 tripartite tricarboxylate transporter substrate binding protein [Rhodocyclaceae bacterium]MCA3038672.1 tripartite tricarboxylate transporter substrate binding protein [Rhodocyclaceae bacterium]MCA3047792.1 tripartite tricarboxylate transporter substrate binding protein [Rhodocyclaceae bact
MKSLTKTVFQLVAALIVLSTQTLPAFAQAWPNKPVKLVAVFPPGGSVDQVARILSVPLQKVLGQPVIVDNKGGASGSIGTAAVAKSDPDGYTFAVVFDTHGVNPSLIPNLSYDTKKDLAPVMLISRSAMMLAAHPSSGFKSFTEVVAAAKKEPGKFGFASIGSGSLAHLALTQLQNQGSFQLTHVPYKGGGPALQDAVAGHVPLIAGTVFLISPQVDGKNLVPLAVTSAKRIAKYPDVKTIAEQGFPGYESVAWWGVFAPAKTPPEIVKAMNDALATVLADPAVREKLTLQGMEIIASKPDELAKFVDVEIDRWAKVIRDNKIKAG